jgi:glycosyltransferase involved in cell wall biosynthesis
MRVQVGPSGVEAAIGHSDASGRHPRRSVLLLITRMNIGGPAGQVLALAKSLGADVPALLAAGRPGPDEGELTDPSVPVRRVPLVRPVRPATDLHALLSVGALLHETGAGVLHTHMAKAGAVGRLAAISSLNRRARPRLVHTYHGHVLEGYFGRTEQRAFLGLERRLARKTDVLIAVSPEVRDELVDLGVGRPGQYRVLPIGLDLTRLVQVGGPGGPTGKLRAALGLPDHVPLIGVLGRLVPIKDHSTLFHALLEVPGAHLVVLGDGELRRDLESLSRELHIAERVHFTGWWTDVAAALADLDVVALSSRNEGTPVALIEALAAGRPVVATDVGGVRHVVQDGETGWLSPAGDAVALGQLLRRALSNGATPESMAQEGRRRVVGRFGAQRMVADHLALYQELLRS